MRHLTALLVLAAVALTGCGVSIGGGDDTISKADVAKEAQKQLDKAAQKAYGVDFPPVTCPAGLKEKKGATVTCTATGKSGPITVDVTVRSIDDGTVNLNFQTHQANGNIPGA